MLEPEDLIGREFGKYTILEQIGKGGMGIVYKARQTSLNRTVALKVLPSLIANEKSMVARFRREAEAAANLNHPNIVSVFDVGEERGLHYFAMAFIDGSPLSTVMAQQGRLDPERAMEIVSEVAQGLGAAHEAGLVHRDIKPGNILIDKKGHAKIVDFGLVQSEASTRITSTGTLLGTILYMSPEQCCGEKLDGRSDIFSLGVVLYRMLSGRVPFDAGTPVATTRLIVEEDPVPIQELKPDLPPFACSIVEKMMAKDVEDRYQTAEELLFDVDACKKMLHSDTVPAAGRTFLRRVRRKRWFQLLLGAAVVVAVAALIFLSHTLWKAARLDSILREAEASLDRGLTTVAAGEFRQLLRLAPDHKRAKLGMAYCLVEMSDFERAAEMFSDPDLGGARSQVGLAAISYAQGAYDEAERLCNEAATAFPSNAYVYTILGNIHFARGDARNAIEQYQLALQKGALLTWQRAATYNNLGRAYSEQGEVDLALRHFARAAEVDNARYRTDYAFALQKADRYNDAMTQVSQVLETDPGDEFTKLLKAQIEQRMVLEYDEHQRRAFRERVDELAKMYQEQQQDSESEITDDWTSRPTVLSLTVDELSGPTLRPGMANMVVTGLMQLLSNETRIQPPREIDKLDAVLQELRLGSSDLADRDTAQRLGRLFAANLVGNGSIGTYEGDVVVTLRFKETETGLNRIIVMETFEKGTGITEIAGTLADGIVKEVQQKYPLKARVLDVLDENSISVNIGAKQGLQKDVEMDIHVAEKDRTGATMIGRRIGRAKMSSVDQNQAVATILERSGEVEVDMLLMELADAR